MGCNDCQRNVRNVVRVVITLLALSICAYQIYIVCDIYYRYPTTVDIRLDPSPYVHLPGITICSELSSTILVEELVKIEPTIYNIFAGKTRTEIALMLKKRKFRDMLLQSLYSQPINKQHQLTVSSSMFFKQCQLPTPLGRHMRSQKNKHYLLQWWDVQSYNRINCTKLGPILETISYEFKCFTLFLNQSVRLGHDSNYEIPKDVAANLKYLAWIRLNRDFIFNGLIYIHSHETTHQFSSTSNIQQLDPDKHQFVSVAFERQITQLLPPPYATKCRDYRQDGYACRDDCMTRCKTKRYLALDGWPGDVYADRNVTQHFSKAWRNPWSSSGHLEEGVDPEMLANCTYECGHWDDCDSVLYDVRTVRVRERDEQDFDESHSFTIGILPPKNVQLINRHVPKMEPIEFLVYIGSLISLYLGISVVSVSVAIVSFATFSSKLQDKLCCSCSKEEEDYDKNGRVVRKQDSTIYRNLPTKS